MDIPSPGGTKRHFCFLWSPSSGINTASCNLSLEPSKTLRHLMTLQGRLLFPWRAGGRGEKVGRVDVQILNHCIVYIQLSSALRGRFNTQPLVTRKQQPQKQLWTVLSSPSASQSPTERSFCIQIGRWCILTPAQRAQHSRTTSVSFADCT